MIDFTKIRGTAVEAQRHYFEQLVCHLAALDGVGEFRRIHGAGGDGGVEAHRLLHGGRTIGYQAKFYPSAAEIDWSKLDDSVETALTQHTDLSRYIIALPCDFTGKRAVRGGASTEGVWGKWDLHVAQWHVLAQRRNIVVAFEPWTAFELETRLFRPDAHHLRQFFFNQLVFSDGWMKGHAERTLADLQARYSPDEHVDTESLMSFDVVFRRESVRDSLHEVFAVARGSNPRAAAALTGGGLEQAISTVEELAKHFQSFEIGIDAPFEQPWPISAWFESWHALTWHLGALHREIEERAQDDASLLARIREATKAYDLITEEVFGGNWARYLSIDALRCVLFVGRAGAGKSHVLARGAQHAMECGAPLIHILGQHILDDDPRASMLKRLGLDDWTFDDFLSALNLAAEAAQTRALLVIDALNEGRGTEVWRNHLAGMIHDVGRHDRIVLMMSCREEYLDYVVPTALLCQPSASLPQASFPPGGYPPLGRLVRVRIDGFSTVEEQEAALQQFMDKKGIARPTAPLLDRELFNPLFMSSVCRAMANAGIKVFPQGLHGARDLFAFVLDAKTKALGTPHDGSPRTLLALKASLDKLAEHMANGRADHVPLETASRLISNEFSSFPVTGRTWLDVLEGADILRVDIDGAAQHNSAWARPKEVVRFAFERLQDNLIADHLIRSCSDIDNAFGQNGPWEFLIKRFNKKTGGTPFVQVAARWTGPLGALWAYVAEDYGRELFDLPGFFSTADCQYYAKDFRPVFRTSVRERKLDAFTDRTKLVLDKLWEDEPVEKLEIYLSVSCIPGHAWNADFIASRLAALSPEELDSSWAQLFVRTDFGLIRAAKQITGWAQTVHVEMADTEVVRLARIILSWLTVVQNDAIAHQAEQGLARLGAVSD